jgi:hypothetical protein
METVTPIDAPMHSVAHACDGAGMLSEVLNDAGEGSVAGVGRVCGRVSEDRHCKDDGVQPV